MRYKRPNIFRRLRRKKFIKRSGKFKQVKKQYYTWKFVSDYYGDGGAFTSWGRKPLSGTLISSQMSFHSRYTAFFGWDTDRNRTWMMKAWNKPARYYKWNWNKDKW